MAAAMDVFRLHQPDEFRMRVIEVEREVHERAQGRLGLQGIQTEFLLLVAHLGVGLVEGLLRTAPP